MRDVVLYLFLSLDGVAEEPSDWFSEGGPELFANIARVIETQDDVLLGRGTYDKVLTFPAWPYGDKRCVVLTHASYPSRHGERFHAGAPAPLLAELQTAGVRRIYVDGGAVIRQFLRDGLIDDLTLSIVPIVLGEGIPLFDASVSTRRLRLAGSQAFPSGLVQLRYDVTG